MYNVDKINFMQPKEELEYACNTMPISVVSMREKNATSKISWIH